MNHLVELAYADKGELDIPATSITFVEGLVGTKNDSFPQAGCFIRYSIDAKDHSAILRDTFEELRTATMVGGAPDWCEAMRADNGNPIRFRATHVDLRVSVDDPDREDTLSEIGLMLDRSGTRAVFPLTQTIAEVRAMMAPAPAMPVPPPGVMPLPVEAPAPNRAARRIRTRSPVEK